MASEVGNVFEGRVTGVKPFGAFVALPEGGTGMVHISEVSNEFVQDIAAVLHIGDTVKVPSSVCCLLLRASRVRAEAPQAEHVPALRARAAPVRVDILVQAAAAMAVPPVRAAEALPVTAHPVCGSPRLRSIPTI